MKSTLPVSLAFRASFVVHDNNSVQFAGGKAATAKCSVRPRVWEERV